MSDTTLEEVIRSSAMTSFALFVELSFFNYAENAHVIPYLMCVREIMSWGLQEDVDMT